MLKGFRDRKLRKIFLLNQTQQGNKVKYDPGNIQELL